MFVLGKLPVLNDTGIDRRNHQKEKLLFRTNFSYSCLNNFVMYIKIMQRFSDFDDENDQYY